jgi:hypothetical protein
LEKNGGGRGRTQGKRIIKISSQQKMHMESPISYFTNLPDPRIDRCKAHLLEDIIIITIAAVLCGAEGRYLK